MGDIGKKKVKWLYVGQRISDDGTKKEIRFAYREYVEGEKLVLGARGDLDNSMYFGKALGARGKRGDIVGGIYEGEIETHEDGSLTAFGVGGWFYQGRIKDAALRASLKATEDVARGEFEAWKGKKEDASKDPLLEYLKPVREAYHRTNTAGKRALIAKVLEYIGR